MMARSSSKGEEYVVDEQPRSGMPWGADLVEPHKQEVVAQFPFGPERMEKMPWTGFRLWDEIPGSVRCSSSWGKSFNGYRSLFGISIAFEMALWPRSGIGL